MFYYEIIKSITNIYDTEVLRVVGFVRVFTDEAKTDILTEIPFGELGIYDNALLFENLPHDSTESFNEAIEQLILPTLEGDKIQNKLNQVKTAKELGLI